MHKNSVSAASDTELPWCGHCNERTRLRQDVTLLPGGDFAEGPVRRCECHPLALLAAETGCGKHSGPPGTQCALCEYGIGIISHDTCSPEANCCPTPAERPMPHEPIDLTKATIQQMARERAELRDSPWFIWRIEQVTVWRESPRYQTALRDLALRQIEAAR